MNRLARYRDEFPVSRTHIFLNHAGVAPTSTRAADAVHRFMDSLVRLGRPSFDDWESLATGCRERFARLVGCGAGEVAFVRNTSHGLSLLAAGLDWRPGDRVAAAAQVEYPSNVYPWMDLDRRVLFCVDGIQTVGALQIDVKEAGIHFLSADSHKWMLGIMGIGAVFVDRSVVERIHPPLLGWRSTTDAFNFDRVHFELLGDAGRYEEGSLAYPLIAGFSAALELLEEAGIERVQAHVCALVVDLAGRLEALGCVTAPDAACRRHILTFRHPGLGGEELLEGLEAAGVVASLRRGSVRVSPHLYNTHDEMEQVAEMVRVLLEGDR